MKNTKVEIKDNELENVSGGGLSMTKDIKKLNDSELENVTGGTEPGEWSIPENGLPRPIRHTEPLNDTPEWNANDEWTAEIPEAPKPGKYEIYGVAWGQD